MRHDLFPGTRGSRYLCARVSGGAAEHGEAGKFPAGVEAGRRALFLSPPMADGGLLGISNGVYGLEPVDGDLSGALQPVSGKSRIEASDGREGVGVSGRRRNG